mgnify:CR=1 FL=1
MSRVNLHAVRKRYDEVEVIRGIDLEVRDGEIFRNDVPFDRLNTAQQVEVAVEVAKLRAADLGVICVDRIECLDSASLEAFRKSALESGLQLFVTRVADHVDGEGFQIETDD